MNTQQHRQFFQAVKSVGEPQQTSRPHSRPRGLAVILSAVLLCSCASLTPERLNLILDLVGAAAQVGIRLYLDSNPGQRTTVEAVLAELAALSARGTPPTEQELSAVLRKLPEEAWKGRDAEIYFSGTNIVNVWDNRRLEVHSVEKKDVAAVTKMARSGAMAGMTPVPPLPVRAPKRAVPVAEAAKPLILYVTNETVILVPQESMPMAESPTLTVKESLSVPAGKFAPRGRGVGVFRVERKDGTNWSEVQSFSSGVGEFRVRRVR